MFIDKFESEPRKQYKIEKADKMYVYFLKHKKEIVYVGISKVLGHRIYAHSRNKEFDEVEYIEIPEDYAFFIEYYYIQKYLPKYNKGLYPSNGFGDYNSLKKPKPTTSIWLKKFIYVHNLKPLAFINNERFFSQKFIEDKWSEIYGSYRPLNDKDKKELTKAYNNIDPFALDLEMQLE